MPIFALTNRSGCSSARFRVLVWGASGRKFESCHPDPRKSTDNHPVIGASSFKKIIYR